MLWIGIRLCYRLPEEHLVRHVYSVWFTFDLKIYIFQVKTNTEIILSSVLRIFLNVGNSIDFNYFYTSVVIYKLNTQTINNVKAYE